MYVLSLGSNDGDREQHLINALNYLAEVCDSIYSSTHYASPALGGGKPHYLNSVAMVEYAGSAAELDALLKEMEKAEGRDETARREGRVPLDIDIVMDGRQILRPKDYALYFFRRGYEELISAGIAGL